MQDMQRNGIWLVDEETDRNKEHSLSTARELSPGWISNILNTLEELKESTDKTKEN